MPTSPPALGCRTDGEHVELNPILSSRVPLLKFSHTHPEPGEIEESWQPDWTEKYSTYQSALCKEFMLIENQPSLYNLN